jgi:hypothetical protein
MKDEDGAGESSATDSSMKSERSADEQTVARESSEMAVSILHFPLARDLLDNLPNDVRFGMLDNIHKDLTKL